MTQAGSPARGSALASPHPWAALILAGCVVVASASCATAPSGPPLDAPAPSPSSTSSMSSTSSTPSPARTASTGPVPGPTSFSPPARTTTITAAGVGDLRVGMSLADGVARGLVVPGPRLCADVDTDRALAAYPDVHTDWTADGLHALVIIGPEYSTAAGVKVGDTLQALQKAYGSRLTQVPRDLAHVESLGGRGGPLTDRYGATLPMVFEGAALIAFPIWEGHIDHIQVARLGASGLPALFVGECS